ncbi:MAG: hypothetical protein WCJ49_04865 [Deltaproteobacteria bacterium]
MPVAKKQQSRRWFIGRSLAVLARMKSQFDNPESLEENSCTTYPVCEKIAVINLEPAV